MGEFHALEDWLLTVSVDVLKVVTVVSVGPATVSITVLVSAGKVSVIVEVKAGAVDVSVVVIVPADRVCDFRKPSTSRACPDEWYFEHKRRLLAVFGTVSCQAD